MGYSGGKRKIYLRACKWIDYEGYRDKDAQLTMFVKADKFPVDEIEDKPPRAIQFRSPKYNLLLASFLKQLEHQFYEEAMTEGLPDIAKGKNNQERARILLAKRDQFQHPVFFNSDYSKMDSCVRPEMQRCCFQWYLKVCPSKLLRLLLWKQLKNVGRSKHGIRYKVPGTRASGDFTTGFENTLINWVCLKYIAFKSGCQVQIFVDGDDALIITEEWDASKFRNTFTGLIGKLGFEVKLVQADKIHQVSFCQSRVLECEVPIMARNPLRALSNHNISVKHYPAQVWPRLNEAKALCEYHSNPGCPVLNPLFKSLLTGIKPLFDNDTFAAYQDGLRNKEQPVTPLARELFHQAWGISPHEQLALEQEPVLVSCGLKSVTGRTHGSANYSEISAQFANCGSNADYGCFSNW